MTRLMQQQLNDDAVAIKLGRAFMLGRLHCMQEVRDAFDPFGPAACETIDECNLYAGGYQYDLQDGQGDRSKNHLLSKFYTMEKAAQQERIKRVMEIEEHLHVLHTREVNEGLSLELVEERCNLRIEIVAHTTANLMTGVKALEIRMLMDGGLADSMADEQGPNISLANIERSIQSYFDDRKP
jgi:hypothetical protein